MCVVELGIFSSLAFAVVDIDNNGAMPAKIEDENKTLKTGAKAWRACRKQCVLLSLASAVVDINNYGGMPATIDDENKI
jgi:hypothetical protein